MVMSTQTLREASRALEYLLVDRIQLMEVGEPQTVGSHVTRELTPIGEPIPGLVQTTVLENAVESRVNDTYSIKMAALSEVRAGNAVKVIRCVQEPDLVGSVLLLDKVSQNGLSLIRKCVATRSRVVNQEGKEVLL